MIAQGDTADELYVVEAGVADVFVADSGGREHRVGSVHAGGTLGEMSLFTGQPATGTVRAASDLDVLIVHAPEFERIAAEFPVVYRNLGAILSERLARTNRLAMREGPGRVVFLRDWGAPPLLVYALAASIAWHTRGQHDSRRRRRRSRGGQRSGRCSAPMQTVTRSGGAAPTCSRAARMPSARRCTSLGGGSYDSILVHLREDAPGRRSTRPSSI